MANQLRANRPPACATGGVPREHARFKPELGVTTEFRPAGALS